MIAPARAASCAELAARVHAISGAMDDSLRDVVGRRVLDTLGALVAGARVEASVALGRVAGDAGPLADVRRLCATVRCSEVDDFDRWSCTTPGSVAVPVALVVGAARAAPPDRLVAGVVAGYEAMIAVGEAIDGPHRLADGVWPSLLAAPVGAAATAAVALGLDERRTTHAVAIAATRAVGTAGRVTEEPTSRWLTYGCAAADGTLAALAAQAGMLGDATALDVALPAATGLTFGGDRLPAIDDPEWRVARVDVKPFCTARQALAAVEAARLASAELGDAPVTGIEIAVPEAYRAMVDQRSPAGRLASIVSAQRQIAVALICDELLYDVARDDLRLPRGAADLMGVTRVVADPELSAMYPDAWPARVRMRSGDRDVERVVRDPLGSRERPLGWDELHEKHARIGAWGDGLVPALRLCRELGDGAAGAHARQLLDLTTMYRSEEAVT